jgi:sugar phosphate isomerase/epimerase
MLYENLTRRRFMKGALWAAAAGVAVPARAVFSAEGNRHPVRLGGPVFDAGSDPEEMARAHRKVGYRAAYCPGVSLDDAPRIKAISEAFRKNDVVISEVGRWCNLLDADPEKRKANLKNVTEGLALADAIGALCCVDIAGSYSRSDWFGPSPDNVSKKFFDETVENARAIIDAVKPKRAKLAFEMMGWAIPDSPDSYLDLIRAVDREAFGVHLDPCNLINCPSRFWRNRDLLNECFDKLGKWIVSCHAKDLQWKVEMNIHFLEVRPGTGVLDYATYLDRLASLPHEAPLMIEHLAGAEEYDKARLHVLEVGKKGGIEF